MSGAGTSSRRFLLAAPTEVELGPLRQADGDFADYCDLLLTGVGPAACAATLAAHLARQPDYAGVIMVGVAGLYPQLSQLPAAAAPSLLSICLAQREILADFGLQAPHGADPFGRPELDGERDFDLTSPLLSAAAGYLTTQDIPFYRGTFLTLSAATVSAARGQILARHYRALCENMEGAAAALVCRRYRLPLLELRCISNLVEDRDLSRWRLAQAAERLGEVLPPLLPLLNGYEPVTVNRRLQG